MPPQCLLVVSAGIAHPSFAARLLFRSAIQEASARQGLRPVFLHSTRCFADLEPGRHAAVAALFHRKEIRAEDLAALDAFVAAGGGLFALHGCVASFKGEERWGRLLGGVFEGHGAIGAVTVQPAPEAREFAGVGTFEIRDELYRIKTTGPVDVRLLASAEAAAPGSLVPVVWTRRHGKGRVCCCSLGHTVAALRSAGVREVITRGVAWVTAPGGEGHEG